MKNHTKKFLFGRVIGMGLLLMVSAACGTGTEGGIQSTQSSGQILGDSQGGGSFAPVPAPPSGDPDPGFNFHGNSQMEADDNAGSPPDPGTL